MLKHSAQRFLLYLLAIAAVIAGWSSSAATSWADAKLEGTNPAQWRLVWKSDPATAATLCWNTLEAGEKHRVRIRQDGETDERIVESSRDGRYSAKSPTLSTFIMSSLTNCSRPPSITSRLTVMANNHLRCTSSRHLPTTCQ